MAQQANWFSEPRDSTACKTHRPEDFHHSDPLFARGNCPEHHHRRVRNLACEQVSNLMENIQGICPNYCKKLILNPPRVSRKLLQMDFSGKTLKLQEESDFIFEVFATDALWPNVHKLFAMFRYYRGVSKSFYDFPSPQLQILF